jgi:hypothetical protein
MDHATEGSVLGDFSGITVKGIHGKKKPHRQNSREQGLFSVFRVILPNATR